MDIDSKILDDYKLLIIFGIELISFIIIEEPLINLSDEKISLAKELLDISSQDLSVSSFCNQQKYYSLCIYHLQQSTEKIIKSLYVLSNKKMLNNKIKSFGHNPGKRISLHTSDLFIGYEQLDKVSRIIIKTLHNIEKDSLCFSEDEKFSVFMIGWNFLKYILIGTNFCKSDNITNKVIDIFLLSFYLENHSDSTRYPSTMGERGCFDYDKNNYLIINYDIVHDMINEAIQSLYRYIDSKRC